MSSTGYSSTEELVLLSTPFNRCQALVARQVSSQYFGQAAFMRGVWAPSYMLVKYIRGRAPSLLLHPSVGQLRSFM
jgi:hypothetical protein